MKKVFLFTFFVLLVLVNGVYAQSKSNSFISWNKALGIGVGYTKMYKDFNTQFEGVSAPQDLIHFDLTIYGVYAGIDFMVKDTGYDVYGYSEKLDTWALKFGPSFKIGKSQKWRCVLTPYAGVVFYSLFDGSNNDIGARDEYGTKESKFLGGCRLSVVYDWYYLGLHCSNREFGITAGIEFTL